MSTPHITHLKLEWLRRRRDELRELYDALASRVGATTGELEKVEVLRRGLAKLRTGSELLHPEALVLEDVLPLGRLGTSMEAWSEKLEQELAWGRARAEYGWLFAALVEEWVSTADASAARSKAKCAAARPVEGVNAPFDLEVIGGIVSESSEWQEMRHAIAKYGDGDVLEPVISSEVETALEAIANGPYRSREVRVQARALAGDETLRGEYNGAVTLMLDGYATWKWPSEGIATRVVEAIDRHRTYLEPELLEALFVQVVGNRWTSAWNDAIDDVARPTKHREATALETLRHELDYRTFLRAFYTVGDDKGSSHYVAADAVFDGPDAYEDVLIKIHTRVQGLHSMHAASTVFVVMADIEAFGPSMPHEVIDRIAERVGVSPAWRAFFARYLAVPVRDAGGHVGACRRGIFPDQTLALGLAELVMAGIEARIYEATGVRLIRLVDDFAFVTTDQPALAAAWELFKRLVAAAGLTLKPEKTGGTVVFGEAPLPAGIPAGTIRVGHLVLGRDGVWTIDEVAVGRALDETRVRVNGSSSVFEAAQVFSDCVRVTLRRMAPFAPFGAGHIRQIAKLIAPFYEELDGHGIVAYLVARMTKRMPDLDVSIVPAGVWFWPRTAGGVGLFDAAAQLAALHSSWRKAPAPIALPAEVSDETIEAFKRGFSWYRVTARQPPFSPEVEGRIADFVRRGDELRGKDTDEDKSPRQLRHQLSFYWQWVAAIHSPTVLEQFGTFRFVEASRVPLGAISELGWLGSH